MCRTLTSLLAFSLFCTAAAAGWDIELQLDVAAALGVAGSETDASGNTGNPFDISWNVKGIEEAGRRYSSTEPRYSFYYSAYRDQQLRTQVEAKRDITSITAGAWPLTPSPIESKTAAGNASADLAAPSPPFDMRWLADSLWPRTRPLLDPPRAFYSGPVSYQF